MTAAAGCVAIEYPHRRAGHCGSGSLRDLLEFHRLAWGDAPLSEGMAFGLGGGLGFAFVEVPALDPPIYMVGRTAGLERDICTHLGVELDLRQTDDPGEGWRWLKDALDAGRPTMIWADIAQLEYLSVRLQMTMHDIVVTGYDEREGVALIADNDRDEIQRCSLTALAAARNSSGFPAPNRHATWLMDFPAQLPEPRATITAATDTAIANMREGSGSSLGTPSHLLGLAGVDALAASYPEWPGRFGERLGGALRGLYVFIVKAGTGGALFRSLHAEFLHDAAELLGDGSLRDAAGVYDELTDAWVALAAATAGDDPMAAHDAGLARLARVAELERAGVEAMAAWRAAAPTA